MSEGGLFQRELLCCNGWGVTHKNYNYYYFREYSKKN